MPEIPEGVSSISDTGERTHVESSSTRPAAKKRRDDVIDTSKGRRVDPNSPPPGVMRNRVDIVEIPIENTRSDRHSAAYNSCDGQSYTFRTHSTRGEADPRRETLCLFLAMREISLGGSAIPVLNAFKLTIDDADGKQVFPIVDKEEVEEADVSFSLGE